jgi:hypothetical protein
LPIIKTGKVRIAISLILNTWQRIPAMNIARRSPGVANYEDR